MISSDANQTFYVADAPIAISPITVTSDSITAASDIRIRIPLGFNMTWDTLDTSATITGSAASKVSTTVSYPNASTLLVNVTSDFAAWVWEDIAFSNAPGFVPGEALCLVLEWMSGLQSAEILYDPGAWGRIQQLKTALPAVTSIESDGVDAHAERR